MLYGNSPSSWAMVNTSGEYMPLENSVRMSLSEGVIPVLAKTGLAPNEYPWVHEPGSHR